MSRDRKPTAELLAKIFEYDPETGELTWRPSLHRHGGTPAGLGCAGGLLHVRFGGWQLYVHQIAWALAHRRISDRVRHISDDRADNRLCNLTERTEIEKRNPLALATRYRS
jgi:hypothetical protein